MRILNTVIITALAIISLSAVQAQNENNKWILSIGANAVSMRPGNSLEDSFSSYFNVGGQGNFMAPISYVTVGRQLKGGLSVGVTGSWNTISKFVHHNNTTDKYYVYNPGDLSFLAVDLNARYSLQNALNSEVFDPYLYAGIGGTGLSGYPSTFSGNYGIGLNAWVLDHLAITFQTGFRQQTGTIKNQTQHLLGLTFGFGAKDQDKDRVADDKDECPTVPGLKQFNGCPDTDGDGIADKDDNCPEVAGLEDLKGCPDTDGDGITDKDDQCPSLAGTSEMMGCPDTDGDGVADHIDECKEEKGAADNKGCPWPDTDGDGTVDKDDKCPNVKGAIDNAGCPVVSEEVIKKLNSFLTKAVLFETGKTTLSEEANAILNEMAALMIEYGNDKFQIEGHTDSVGDEVKNQELSEKRAASIKQYLIEAGVDANNLTSKGYGEYSPIASNRTRAGRAKNRRVEIIHMK